MRIIVFRAAAVFAAAVIATHPVSGQSDSGIYTKVTPTERNLQFTGPAQETVHDRVVPGELAQDAAVIQGVYVEEWPASVTRDTILERPIVNGAQQQNVGQVQHTQADIERYVVPPASRNIIPPSRPSTTTAASLRSTRQVAATQPRTLSRPAPAQNTAAPAGDVSQNSSTASGRLVRPPAGQQDSNDVQAQETAAPPAIVPVAGTDDTSAPSASTATDPVLTAQAATPIPRRLVRPGAGNGSADDTVTGGAGTPAPTAPAADNGQTTGGQAADTAAEAKRPFLVRPKTATDTDNTTSQARTLTTKTVPADGQTEDTAAPAAPAVSADTPATTQLSQFRVDSINNIIEGNAVGNTFTPTPRSIIAVVGERVNIILAGSAWTYVGPQKIDDLPYVEILSRQLEESVITYQLQFLREGVYSIRFQNQQSVDGAFQVIAYQVAVTGTGAPASAPSTEQTEENTPPLAPETPATLAAPDTPEPLDSAVAVPAAPAALAAPVTPTAPAAALTDTTAPTTSVAAAPATAVPSAVAPAIAAAAAASAAADAAAATSFSAAINPTTPAETAALLQLIDRLIADGLNTQALIVLQRIDTTGALSPENAEQAAILASTIEEYQYARRFWERNLTADSQYAARARAALTTIAIAQGNLSSAAIYAQDMLQSGDTPSESALLALGEYYTDSARYPEAAELYTIFAENYPNSSMYDRYLWGRGQLAELNPAAAAPFGSYEAALQDYQTLVERYPLSRYWEQARSRTTFIRRHIIDLR